jgi:hypothetical protein
MSQRVLAPAATGMAVVLAAATLAGPPQAAETERMPDGRRSCRRPSTVGGLFGGVVTSGPPQRGL